MVFIPPGERFNSWTHIAGASLALAGSAMLITLAAQSGDAWKIVSCSLFAFALICLYGVSALYHSSAGRAKAILRKCDHCAIYLLIAGTYMPFSLVSLRGGWGWSIFGVTLGLAVFGIVQELTLAKGGRPLSMIIYLVMGWLGLIAVLPLVGGLGIEGFSWIAAGGLFYTVGILFYAFDEKWRHAHGIWHLFVLGGSATHYFAVLRFVV